MQNNDSLIAVFDDHESADAAIRKLVAAGFAMQSLSIVGKGYHINEHVAGFYNQGDRVVFWGKRGAFWGGLWGLFFGGLFLTIPVVGNLIVLGYLVTAVMSAIEGAVVVGGLSAIGAALAGIGVPKDSLVRYEAVVQSDGFLVMAHAPAKDIERAKDVLGTLAPQQLDHHTAG